MHKHLLVCLVMFISLPGWPAAADIPERGCDPYVQQIDDLWNRAYAQIYSVGLDRQTLCMMSSMMDLCSRAVAEDPDNYEYLWRYARSAAEYAQTAQSLPDEFPEWKDICRQYGMSGFKMADRACMDRPDRPEAFFWRNYCMGMYVLIGGITPIINAVKEGFLGKAEESVVKGYEADKTYLDYIPVFTRSQFLAHVPSIPFIVKGSKEDRYKEAMCYHKEHNAYTLHRIEEVFEWDICATYSAQFMLDAVKVLDPAPCEKRQYLEEARRWCNLGLQSPRSKYVKMCEAMLADNKRWK